MYMCMHVWMYISLLDVADVIQSFGIEIKLVVSSSPCLWEVQCTISCCRFIQIPRGSLLPANSPSRPTQASFLPSLLQLRCGIQVLAWISSKSPARCKCVCGRLFLKFRALSAYLSCCEHLKGPRSQALATIGGLVNNGCGQVPGQGGPSLLAFLTSVSPSPSLCRALHPKITNQDSSMTLTDVSLRWKRPTRGNWTTSPSGLCQALGRSSERCWHSPALAPRVVWSKSGLRHLPAV